MEETSLYESRKRAAEHIRRICAEYGMYGNIFHHTPSSIPDSDRNRVYVIAGTHPDIGGERLPKWVYPEDIIRRSERNNKLFYPNIWAFDLSSNGNEMTATEELVDYLKKAEFIRAIYAEHGMDPPEKLRLSEVHQLIDFRDMADNVLLDKKTRENCKKDLEWFFRREHSQGLRKKWLEYFRSEKFPDDKGPVAKLSGYFNQGQQETSIQQLMEVNEEVHKLQMEEHEYKLFKNFISKVYPDVVFAAGEKSIVDHGGVGNPKDTEEAIGRRVTGEEFAVIRKEHFAEQGWQSMKDLKPSYWEFRDVYYKACDEPLVAAVYNSITLQYSKCDLLADLPEPVDMIDVPKKDFMNFVSLAKTNKLRFYIDHFGDFAVPSLDNIHVIYSQHQSEKLYGVLTRMLSDKIEFSHVLEDRERPALSRVIQDMEDLRLQHQPDHILTNRGNEYQK